MEDEEKGGDLRMNGMGVWVKKVGLGEVVDGLGGVDEVKEGRMGSGVDGEMRLREDGLGMMGWIGFGRELNLYIEDERLEGVEGKKEGMKIIWGEGMGEEVKKILV